jgi:hypothetical protein
MIFVFEVILFILIVTIFVIKVLMLNRQQWSKENGTDQNDNNHRAGTLGNDE